MTASYVPPYRVRRQRCRITGRGGQSAALSHPTGLRAVLCRTPRNPRLSADAPLSRGIRHSISSANSITERRLLHA